MRSTIHVASVAALTLSLITAFAHTVEGQDPRRTASPEECSEAIRALRSAQVPELGADPWWIATRCGAEGGQALAELVGRFATESDTARLRTLETVLTDIEDASVFGAVLRVAADPSATPRARVFALMTLLSIHSPLTYVADRTNFPLSGPLRCQSSGLGGPLPMKGAPLPPDYRQQAHRVAKAVEQDASAPAQVRGAARCLRQHLLVREVDPQKIRLTYVCGRKFQIRNDNPDGAWLNYEVEHSSEEGELEVPSGALDFVADEPGTLRLFYEGQLVATEPNRGSTCP